MSGLGLRRRAQPFGSSIHFSLESVLCFLLVSQSDATRHTFPIRGRLNACALLVIFTMRQNCIAYRKIAGFRKSCNLHWLGPNTYVGDGFVYLHFMQKNLESGKYVNTLNA